MVLHPCPIIDPETGCPNFCSLKANYKVVEDMIAERHGRHRACAVGYGGIAEAVFKMGLGNRIGFKLASGRDHRPMFEPMYGVHRAGNGVRCACAARSWARPPRNTPSTPAAKALDLAQLQEIYEGKLEPVYPYRTGRPHRGADHRQPDRTPPHPSIGVAKPKVHHPGVPRHQLRVRHRPGLCTAPVPTRRSWSSAT